MLTRRIRLAGLGLLLALLGASAFTACSSGGDDDDSSSGGSGGSGAGSSTGGSQSQGGDSGGSATSAAGQGGAGQVITECVGVEPPSVAIADFDTPPKAGAEYKWGSSAQGTLDFWGGTFNYPDALMLSFEDGAMTASGHITEYAGFGLYVQNCADASSFEGVRFKIKGDPPSGKMHFAVQTNRNEWANGTKGSCLASDALKFIDCVHPSVEIDVSDTLSPVEVKWSDLGAGLPKADATTDGSDVIGLQFILPWTETGTDPYDVSVTIDDVEFIGPGGGGAGGGGAGGAGPGPAMGGAGGAP